jgi:hypothetical protein
MGSYRRPVEDNSEALISQSSILVDPFSPLHHQWVAWILSGWSSLHAPPIPFGIPVVWHDVVIVGELFEADCPCPVLFRNFWWETLHVGGGTRSVVNRFQRSHCASLRVARIAP